MTLPHGSFAIGAAVFTTAVFDIINVLISLFNTLVIYSVKIIHPETFNFNRLPHIVVFFAVPAALIMSWSWLKKRQTTYLFVSTLFFMYMIIHIARVSVTRYMVPFYPLVILFFLLYLRYLSKRTALSFFILSMTTLAFVCSMTIDNVNIPIKVIMCFTTIIAVLILVITRRYTPLFANRYALFIPALIAFFTLSSSLYIIIFARDTQGAPVRSFLEYGYNRECAKIMCCFSPHANVWLNDTGVSGLPLFYRPDTLNRKTHLFDAMSVRYLERCVRKLDISEIGLVVSDLPRRMFANQNLLPDLLAADWLEQRQKIKLKNKSLYLFSVLASVEPINATPIKGKLAESLTPNLSFTIAATTNSPAATWWQIREIDVLATLVSEGETKMSVYNPTTLNGSSWLNAGNGSYTFDGKADLIDCEIPYQEYSTLCAWVKPSSASQKAAVAGNLAYLYGDLWNTRGRGLQYDSGRVYAIGDCETGRSKLSATLVDRTWQHIAVTFSSNGALYVNAALKDSGDIAGGYKYSFAIGQSRVSRPATRSSDLYFSGNIDDVRVYRSALTEKQISNIWLSTKDNYIETISQESNDYLTSMRLWLQVNTNRFNNNVVFSDSPMRTWDSCKVNTVVQRTWDSGVVTNEHTCITVPDGILQNDRIYYWQVRYQDAQGKWSRPSEPTWFRTRAGSEK